MVPALDVLRAEDSRSPNVVVIVDAAASKLEQYAAKEFCGYLDKLYGIGTTPVETIPASADTVLLVP